MSELLSNAIPAQQKDIINKLQKTALKKGDKWFLIATSWFEKWEKYVENGNSSAHPGPVDNSSIQEADGSLKGFLFDSKHFKRVPEEAWNNIVQWYGTRDTKTAIPKPVIEQGVIKNIKIEDYGLPMQICKHGGKERRPHPVSRGDTLETIETMMREIYQIPPDQPVRLWTKHAGITTEFTLQEDPQKTVNDLGFCTNEVFMIEPQREDGSWDLTISQKPKSDDSSNSTTTVTTAAIPSTVAARPSTSNNSYGNSSYSSSYKSPDDVKSRDYEKGVCGLSNIGNTCFMNSAIQCLSNVPVLTDYFLQRKHEKELNFDNPLGMKGEIAKAYADVIRMLWSGLYQSTAPRDFKKQLETFAPQFIGYQQHDSQELMAFLLDGLHEDLNRIKKKPYVEVKDSNGRPDDVVSKEAWSDYRLRNNSVIVDTFYGLLKSTVQCPECSKVSATFDPFCYLSVPLPQTEERQIEVTFVPWQSDTKPTLCSLAVSKFGTIGDLCNAMAKAADVNPDRLVVCDVVNHRFRELYTDDESVSKIYECDKTHIYEMNVSSTDPDSVFQPVYQREKSGYNWRLFSTPMIVPLPKSGVTYEQLYNRVLVRMRRFLHTSKLDTEWWRRSEKSVRRARDHGESSDGEHDNSESDDDSKDKWEEGSGLFRLVVVNGSGYCDAGPPEKDGDKLRLSDGTFISANWFPDAQKELYDEIPDEDRARAQKADGKKEEKKKEIINLTDCIDLFVSIQHLGDKDLWYCPHCKKHQQATKKLDLWSAPDVLVIHLKRFFHYKTVREKIDSEVQFPLTDLGIAKYVIGPKGQSAVYDLIAVSNHHGGMGSGHYSAYAKNRNNRKWYSFDDEWVKEISEQDVCTKAAYVLVYIRRGDEAPSTPKQSSNTGTQSAASIGESMETT